MTQINGSGLSSLRFTQLKKTTDVNTSYLNLQAFALFC